MEKYDHDNNHFVCYQQSVILQEMPGNFVYKNQAT